MKRDLTIFRKILLDCEESEQERFLLYLHWPGQQVDEKDTKWTDQELHHITLMRDAGLIASNKLHDVYGEGFSLGVEFRITNSGHDFLDAIRDENLWAKTKSAVTETGGNATVEIVKALALGFMKKKITDHTGIAL